MQVQTASHVWTLQQDKGRTLATTDWTPSWQPLTGLPPGNQLLDSLLKTNSCQLLSTNYLTPSWQATTQLPPGYKRVDSLPATNYWTFLAINNWTPSWQLMTGLACYRQLLTGLPPGKN